MTRPTNPETLRALIRANGLAIDTDREMRETLGALRVDAAQRVVPHDIVVSCDQTATVDCSGPTEWHLVLEGSEKPFADGRSDMHIQLPAMPAGVHDLQVWSGQTVQHSNVIAAPSRAPSLLDVAGYDRTWGIVAPLYGLRSERSRGLGDFEDLARLGETLGSLGAGFLGINPVHALGWADEETISPYSPTHRGFLNTNHISLDQIPDVSLAGTIQASSGKLIEYDVFGRQHRLALRAAFAQFKSEASEASKRALHEFSGAGGQSLADFALFETLSETMGSGWQDWPERFCTPGAARRNTPDLDPEFHVWLQWLATQQLADAQRRSQENGMGLGLYLDLAVGSRLDSAEAWGAGDTLAAGVSLGAPPDQLSPAGQNWQLAAYAPRKLTAQKYQPLRQVLRQAMQHCGVLRIDHALGLNRSYWIPENGVPGGYIRQPFQSLMAIIAIEAQRAKTVIVGEDLGLVPDGFRDTMASKGLYGYTVVQYEKTKKGKFRKADELRPQSLACFGTHDTPTIKGFWEGDDIAWWHRLGWIDAASQTTAKHQRQNEKAALMGVPENELHSYTSRDLANRVHDDLAQGPTALVAVQLDDVIGVQDAQNLPGTIDEHPNWRRIMPVSVDEIAQDRNLQDTANSMAQAGRSMPKKET
ncbi:MAG: 4-alpha-glucanotransferase [Paracoccaceae bacterium]|nr:4-alpha-glucanotransferase [Paracoccaceae bacterium]